MNASDTLLAIEGLTLALFISIYLVSKTSASTKEKTDDRRMRYFDFAQSQFKNAKNDSQRNDVLAWYREELKTHPDQTNV